MWASGNHEQAQAEARSAKNISIAALIVGIIENVIGIIIIVLYYVLVVAVVTANLNNFDDSEWTFDWDSDFN